MPGPLPRAGSRRPPELEQLGLQSPSFSRSFARILPTSLTLRSPVSPEAVNLGNLMQLSVRPQGERLIAGPAQGGPQRRLTFHGPSPGARTGRRASGCGGPAPTSPHNALPWGPVLPFGAVNVDRKPTPGPGRASSTSLASPLLCPDPPLQGGRAIPAAGTGKSSPGFRDLNRIPFPPPGSLAPPPP